MNWIDELVGWDEAKPTNRAAGKSIATGYQRALITGVEIADDRPMVKWSLKFLDYDGALRTKVMFFSGKLEYTRKELNSINIDVDDRNKLIDAIKSSVGKVVMVYVRNKEGSKYQDYFFNKDTGETMDTGATIDPFANGADNKLDGWDS